MIHSPLGNGDTCIEGNFVKYVSASFVHMDLLYPFLLQQTQFLKEPSV